MTNKQIENKVNEIWQKYVTKGSSHKQLQKIMTAENIKFKEVDSENPNFVGVFTKGINNQLYIMVNKNINNIGRRNFTIAHELGHYFLKHQLKAGDIIDKNINEDCLSKEPMEYEADYFAACLLMPAGKIIPAFRKIKSNVKNGNLQFVYNRLSESYGVSKEAVTYRLKYLKMIKEVTENE